MNPNRPEVTARVLASRREQGLPDELPDDAIHLLGRMFREARRNRSALPGEDAPAQSTELDSPDLDTEGDAVHR
jgi:hypothetical protein